MDILLLLLLILLNGLFAMSEISLVTAKRSRLARLADDGNRNARAALRLADEPTRLLSTVQIGITSIGILSGIVGEAALAQPLSHWLQHLGLSPSHSGIGATVLVVVVVTYVSIVIGELVPKRVGQLNPERIALVMAQPMRLLATAARPFVQLLSASTGLLLRVLGLRDEHSANVTEEEIHAMLAEGSDAGVIEASEHQMVRNVFRLDERRLGSLMVPRADIIALDAALPLADNLARLASSSHSRMPLCRNGFEEVLGIVSAKQLLLQSVRGEALTLERQLEPAIFVPESLTGMELLQQVRLSNAHMVLVVDEYGEVQGLITQQDLLEAVTGEFQADNGDDPSCFLREDGSWLLDGLLPAVELRDCLGLRSLPDEREGRYQTLAGMMLWLLGRLPETGDSADWQGWRLEVVDLDGKRIDKVLASPLPAEVSDEDG